MGKRTRRALMGFAAGALQGVSDFYRTKAMQDAELQREQRLAAIRAQERGEDRAFQRQTMAEQNEAQAARDERLAAQQAERDKVQGTQRISEIQTTAANQREIAGMQLAGQREIANLPARSAPRDVQIEVPDGKGGYVLRTVSDADPEFRKGIPGARLASQGAQYMNAETRAAAAEAEAVASSPTSTVGGSNKSSLPDFIYVDGKLVPNPAKQ